MKQILKKKVIIPILIILMCVFGWTAYVNDYYKADASVNQYLQNNEADTSGGVTAIQIKDGLLLDGSGTDKALIFYPGGKS